VQSAQGGQRQLRLQHSNDGGAASQEGQDIFSLLAGQPAKQQQQQEEQQEVQHNVQQKQQEQQEQQQQQQQQLQAKQQDKPSNAPSASAGLAAPPSEQIQQQPHLQGHASHKAAQPEVGEASHEAAQQEEEAQAQHEPARLEAKSVQHGGEEQPPSTSAKKAGTGVHAESKPRSFQVPLINALSREGAPQAKERRLRPEEKKLVEKFVGCIMKDGKKLSAQVSS